MSSRIYSAREPSCELAEIASVQDRPSTIDTPNLKRKREIIYAKLEQIEREEEERERKKARNTPKSFFEL